MIAALRRQTAVLMQLKQEAAELGQAERREKRHVQKLQLELLQAKQLLEKLHGSHQVAQHHPALLLVPGASIWRLAVWLFFDNLPCQQPG